MMAKGWEEAILVLEILRLLLRLMTLFQKCNVESRM